MTCSGLLLFGAAFAALAYWLRRLHRRLTATEARLAQLDESVGRLAAGRGPFGGRPESDAPPAVAAGPGEPVPPAAPPPPPVPAVPPAGAADTPPPSRPSLHIDWERWIGMRGAAVLGGVALALAGLLFLKYSIEHGLIPPIVRVTLGLVAGIGAIAGSEALRRRGYEMPANSLAGAGVVLLYAAVWAGAILYGLIPNALAYALMILITASCGALSWRRRSLVVALLGLAGGFATPLLLASERDNPIGLFGYVLLLDAGLLLLARRRRWPVLAPLSLVGTLLYEALWILARMDAARVLLGLSILGVFGILYALAAAGPSPAVGEAAGGGAATADRIWGPTRAAGVLLPLLFAFYFASRADLGAHLTPVAVLLLVLSVAAQWLGRVQRRPLLDNAAAAACVAVVWAWCSTSGRSLPAWELAGVSVGLAAAFHLFLERDRRRAGGSPLSASAPALVAIGLLTAMVLFQLDANRPSLWPWLAGWLLLAALLARQSAVSGRSFQQVVAAVELACAFALFSALHGREPGVPPAPVYFGLALATAVGWQLLAVPRTGGGRRGAETAAIAMPLVLLLGMTLDMGQLAVALFLVTTLLLGVLASLAATRLPSGRVYLLAMAALAFVQWLWTSQQHNLAGKPATALLALALQLPAPLFFTFWPFVAGRRFVDDRWTLYAAALAGPFWFPSLLELFEARFGDRLVAVLPIGLGLLSIVAALQVRRRWGATAAERLRGLVWFLAVALGFLSVAIPLQLDKEWITLGWALEGVAVLALWKRLDHPGLKYLGLALFTATLVRLVANPALLGYYPRSSWRIVNWLMYTYLVPAAALVGGGSILRPLELGRRRDWERRFYLKDRPLAAAFCGVAAILVVFVWINLTIFDYFSTGAMLTFSWSRLQARDLTLSLAWALYAVLLLVLGISRKSVGLRGIGLAFLTLAILKGFLYDLGELTDLYRVAALMGLAASLFGVSLLYYRFVRRSREDGGGTQTPE